MWNPCRMGVASIRERFLAGLVDAAVVILGMVVVVGLGIGAAAAYARVERVDDADETEEEVQEKAPLGSPSDGEGVDDLDDRSCGIEHSGSGPDRSVPGRVRAALRSPLLGAALGGAGAGLAIANRNWRSPGFRVMGLSRVDARSGGPVTVRSALIGGLFVQVRETATKDLFQSHVHGQRNRMEELAPQLREVEHKYAADSQARQRAVMEFYKENSINPLAGCGWSVAGAMLSQLILAAATRGGRTVYDRLTGTIVIRDG